MIYCNLAGLMANKKVNISDVSRDTKISRTTLTSLYYNDYKGVQIDTVDTLCKYFNVGMDKLFMFSKYEISFKIGFFDPMLYIGKTEDAILPITINVKYGNVEKECDIYANVYFFWYDSVNSLGRTSCHMNMCFEYFVDDEEEELRTANDFLRKMFYSLDDEFKEYILNGLSKKVQNEIDLQVDFSDPVKFAEVKYTFEHNLW